MISELQPNLPIKDLIQPQPVAWIMIVRTEPEIGILTAERIVDQSLTFPGGKIEPSERPIEAVIRELDEETGLQISPDQVFTAGTPQTVATVSRSHIIAYPFFAYWGSVSEQVIQFPEPNILTDWKWLSFSDLANSVVNGKLPAGFDLTFFIRLSKLIFDANYNNGNEINYSTSHILDNDHEYVYWSQLKHFQKRLFGKSLDYFDN